MRTRINSSLLVVATFGLAFSSNANAHGLEMVTPYIVWPALLAGVLGGCYNTVRGTERLKGMGNTFLFYFILLAAITVAFWWNDPDNSISAFFMAQLLAGILGAVFGAIPLGFAYLGAEYITSFLQRMFHSSVKGKNDF